MLALRGAIVAAGRGWIVLCLLAAGLSHGIDLWLRWRKKSPPA
jgi:hypothetical protein